MKSTPFRLIVAAAAVSASIVTATAATASVSARSSAPKAFPTCSSSYVTTTKSPINITFWESMPKSILGGTGNYGSIHALVTAFNAAYKGKIVVNDVNQAGGYGQTWTDYVNALATHSTPNVVMFDQYNAQSAADTKSILPVSTCIAANKFSTATFSAKVKGAYTVKGSMVGMPFSASVPVMYYNKQAFAKAGIASPPTTMAQLLADQTKLKATHWSYSGKANCGGKLTCAGTYKYGVSIKYDPWEISTWLGLADKPEVNNSNGHTARATNVSFNVATTQAYVRDLQTVAKGGGGLNVYNPSSSSINVAYGNLFDVANNNSGITFDTTAALGSIQSLLPFYGNVTLGIAPLPTETTSVPGSAPPGGNGLFINKSSTSSAAQQAASWVFISWLESVSNLAKWDYQTGYLPLRTDELAAWNALQKSATQKAWYTVGYNQLMKGKVDFNTEGPLLGPYNQVNNDITFGLQTAFTAPYPSVNTALGAAATKAHNDIVSYNSTVGP